MRRTSWVLMLALLAVVVVSLAGAAQAQAVTRFNVFAAASLNKAFPAEAKAFKARWPRYKDVKFVFNFQGTDTLVAQIQQGAPADVFAGASLKYGTTLYTSNLIVQPVSFCQNKLCAIVPSANPAGIATLAEIPSKAYYVAVGSSSVPIGTYTSTVLDKMAASDAYPDDYKTQVMARAVTCLNVTQVVSLVMLGEVDAGFCYNSDAKYAVGKVKRIAIPNAYQSSPLPTYPIARTVGTRYTKLSQRFVNFVMSDQGQKILKAWGFLPKPPATAAVAQ
jgi:molybdate transport system substrate-binding protein